MTQKPEIRHCSRARIHLLVPPKVKTGLMMRKYASARYTGQVGASFLVKQRFLKSDIASPTKGWISSPKNLKSKGEHDRDKFFETSSITTRCFFVKRHAVLAGRLHSKGSPTVCSGPKTSKVKPTTSARWKAIENLSHGFCRL